MQTTFSFFFPLFLEQKRTCRALYSPLKHPNSMSLFKNNGIIFLINAIIFTVVAYLEPRFLPFWIGILVVSLATTYLLFPRQTFSRNNIIKFRAHRVPNLNGLILTFLFLVNVISSWDHLGRIAILYVVIFSVVQILISAPGNSTKSQGE